ncbi:2Fe-2S iron-sulfur cluster-binding protein [Anaerobacillus alkalilacustris]|uniref:2Fe-2S iron-sulfur cluster-binding protein n=1 Tax=Anaerobacillus alkalilacustris TaxID=393763 RepID=UPI0031844295
MLVNRKPHNSCLTMAYQCEGKRIETIESISEDRLDQIQQIFLEEGGFQCGYCTPGMVISLKGVLNECSNPTVEDLKVGLSGNLCRCTGYGGILRSLERISEYNKEYVYFTRCKDFLAWDVYERIISDVRNLGPTSAKTIC